jgi:hypothetical protein
VGTLAEGNALLPAFMADYNARFGKPPANQKDLHRPLRASDDLDDAFARKEERTLSRARRAPVQSRLSGFQSRASDGSEEHHAPRRTT